MLQHQWKHKLTDSINAQCAETQRMQKKKIYCNQDTKTYRLPVKPIFVKLIWKNRQQSV